MIWHSIGLTKSKGKRAWLITWEGDHAEYNGRCKIVAVLPPQCQSKSIKLVLPVLYCSEYPHTLEAKLLYCIPQKDPWLIERYKNLEITYAHEPEFLMARKVKNLRCEENKQDDNEVTMFWTEFPRCSNDDKEIRAEEDRQYTWSIGPALEAKRKRRASAG